MLCPSCSAEHRKSARAGSCWNSALDFLKAGKKQITSLTRRFLKWCGQRDVPGTGDRAPGTKQRYYALILYRGRRGKSTVCYKM